jgi:hypothetical protein
MAEESGETQRTLEEEQMIRLFDVWNKILEEKGLVVEEKGLVVEEEGQIERHYIFDHKIKNQTSSHYPNERVVITKDTQPPITDPEFKKQKGETWIILEITPNDPYSPDVAKETGMVKGRKTVDYYTQALTAGISNKGRSFQSHNWREIYSPETTSSATSYLPHIKKVIKNRTVFLDPPEHTIKTIKPLSGGNFERLGILAKEVNSGKVYNG